ncbi:MAG: hypothetical protein IJB84_01850 [Lachnospiraceae bacterium]|nr:hypothetical protein [Lachnospiraceae bacterium]
MTRKRSKKSALLMSILSLLTCMTMLIGSTFAWFTDSVTSSGNIIKSGTLKVGMEWADGKTDPANANTSWTDASTGAIFNNDKWEPGYVDAKHIRISNKGTLALKYQLNILANGTVSKLADVIDVYFADGGKTLTGRDMTGLTRVGTLTEVLAGMPANMSGDLDAGKNDTVTIALKMQETANNDYQGLEIGSDFAVQLFATQLTSEEDSFDETYDKFADYDGEISNATTLAAAVKNGGTYKVTKNFAIEDTMTVPSGVEVNLDLGGNDLTGNLEVASGATLVVANGSINNDNSSVSGIQNNGGELVLDDVSIESARHGVRVEGGDVTINGGLYEVKADPNGEKKTQHALNVSDGANVIVNDGTFVGPKGTGADSGSAVNVQAGSTVTIYGGNFSGGLNSTLSASGTLVVYGGTFDQNPAAYVADGYATIANADGTYSVMQGVAAENQTALDNAIKGGEESIVLAAGNYNMLDGSDVNLSGKTLTITGTEDTVIDVRNVDTRDQFVTGASLVFDGVTLNFNDGSGNIYMGFANTASLIYRNCHITGMQFLYGENVIFENCVIDSSANTGEPHSVWTYGAKNINFINCAFIYGNRAVNCYKDQDIDGGKQVVNFKNCTFTTTDANSEGGVEINSSAFSVGIEVNMEGCTAPANGPMAYVSPWDSTNGAKTTINIK